MRRNAAGDKDTAPRQAVPVNPSAIFAKMKDELRRRCGHLQAKSTGSRAKTQCALYATRAGAARPYSHDLKGVKRQLPANFLQ
jgi:hypothetical protein